jgi:hypothetical protein
MDPYPELMQRSSEWQPDISDQELRLPGPEVVAERLVVDFSYFYDHHGVLGCCIVFGFGGFTSWNGSLLYFDFSIRPDFFVAVVVPSAFEAVIELDYQYPLG